MLIFFYSQNIFNSFKNCFYTSARSFNLSTGWIFPPSLLNILIVLSNELICYVLLLNKPIIVG